MLRSRSVITAVLVSLVVSGSVRAAEAPSASAMRAHVNFLADDLLEGREAGTEGFRIAAAYVASQFEQMGLQPAGSRGYLQPVPFVRYKLVADSGRLSIGGQELVLLDDFLVSSSAVHKEASVEAPVVFAGYGIDAPRLGRNDWEGLDVKGKIVALLSGAPTSFPTDERAHYSSSLGKQLEAARRGAVGTLVIRTPVDEARTPWERAKGYQGHESMRWVDTDGVAYNGLPQLRGHATLNRKAAERLFEGSGTTLDQVFAEAEAGTVKGRPLKHTVSISAKSEHATVESENVVAMIPGSDPMLRNEYVVYSAHLDHVGVRPDAQGDKIYNGMYDNAMGISIMLEVARAFAESGQRPKRSIIFAAVTAEEKGLLGAEYFAVHPTVPKEGIVANINLDMPLFLFPVADLIAYGADHSSLGAVAERAARAENFELSKDPRPEEVIFVRSDHYSFVKQGVPALYLVPGSKSLDPTIAGGARLEDFGRKNYHRPSDETTLHVDWPSAVRFARVHVAVGREVANAAAKPSWNQGDFFGDLFAPAHH